MTDTSVNTTQEDTSPISSTTSLRQSKYIRSQTTNTAIHEPKQAPAKPAIARKIHGEYSL